MKVIRWSIVLVLVLHIVAKDHPTWPDPWPTIKSMVVDVISGIQKQLPKEGGSPSTLSVTL